MPNLILLRHGQSTWNLENKFTGWVDIELTALGKEEAKHAGILLKGFQIDIAFTSVLKRAIQTLQIVLAQMGVQIPMIRSAALNERNYGALQGLNKAATAKKYGLVKVLQWRRSFNERPPDGESLKDTFDRVIPYYIAQIKPKLVIKQHVLVVAHGNSLRALMMHLENLDEKQIELVEIATGVPRVYQFSDDMKLIHARYL